ncbi:PBP_domain domain-containing protein [Haematococcus lacustris]|uniref:PBP_domain domain-containing protein n=1 Tax=Haematococcus lacustris TaxID=44745 RepID=A0A699YL73_HAELA|nr:PBP_domain domain-containing protein [Haematococcus lacustris]
MTTKAAMSSVLLIAALLLVLHPASSQRLVWELHGSGSTVPTNEMVQAVTTLSSTAKPSVYASFRAIGTSSGRTEFLSGSDQQSTPPVAFAVSSLPLPTQNYTAMQASGGMLTIPLMVAKIAFYHSVTTSNGGRQVLNLTACTLAKIFSRGILVWDHADIRATNPNLRVASGTRITVMRRLSTFSPSTSAVVQWLASTCANAWPLGTDLANMAWPAELVPASEDEDMLNALSTSMQSPAYRANAIGFIDSALGSSPLYDLAPVALQVQGVFQQVTNADDALIANTLTPGTAWPLLVLPSLLVRKDSSFLGHEGSLLPALINVLLSDSQQSTTLAERHVPLPPSVRRGLITAASSKLLLNATAPTWSFEVNGAAQPVSGAADFTFSFFRKSGLAQAMLLHDQLAANISDLVAATALINANLTEAQSVRSSLLDAIKMNAYNVDRTTKAMGIAVAGIVISVLLAVVAIILAAVYVAKLKKLDVKYQKYISLGKFMTKGDPEGM